MKKLRINRRKLLLCTVSVSVLVLLAFQALIDLSVVRSLIQVRPDYDTVITNLISSAAKQLNKPAPVDPTTGKVYIPEAHLVLPAYTGLGQIEYEYESGQYSSYSTTEIHLSSSEILDAAMSKLWVSSANGNSRMAWQSYNDDSLFGSIPSLQACTRGVQLFYVKPKLGDDFVFQGSHQLNNGRTLYVYSESDCKQDQSAVIDLAKQAQSY